MTEVAEAPGSREARRRQADRHWIGGRSSTASRGGAARSTTRRPARRPARSTSRPSRRSTAPSQTAKDAFPAWRAISLSRRAELFFRIRELVHEHREEIARILTAEHGKVLSDALGEVRAGSR